MAHVATGDMGGGSVDFSTKLDMRSVIDRATTEKSTRVLYAATIDVDAVSALLDQLTSLSNDDGLAAKSSSLINDNDAMMSLTNSDRFYNGDEAKSQFQNMNEVRTRIQELMGSIDKIDKATILSKIELYNTRLVELKTDCRIELLRRAADRWNRAKHEEDGYPKRLTRTGSYYPPRSKTEWGWDSDRVVFEEGVLIRSWGDVPLTGITDPYDTSYQNCEYDWHKYKIIKYWYGFRNVFKFWDPGFEEVEQMFAEVGAPLPYDPAKILPRS